MYKEVFIPALLSLTVVNAASADHHQVLTDDGAPVGWCKPEVVYTVDALTESKLGNTGMRALKNAASHWLGLNGVPLIRVESVAPEGVKAQRITWVDAWDAPEYDRRHLAVTNSEFYYKGTLLNAPIEINGRQPWSFNEEGPDAAHVDFESTMTHEFGHALGLEHSPDPSSVMYYKLDEGEVFREPLDADMDALEATYAQTFPCVDARSVRTQLHSSATCSATDVRAAMGGNHPFLMAFAGVMLAFLYRLFQRNTK